jgi:CRISPR-associated protein Csd2
MSLENKIDFAIIISVKNANPNGDPLNGNRPRVDYDGLGEISDVCLKRKIRNRLLADGQSIFVQSDDNKVDGMVSLKARAESDEYGLGKDAFNSKKTKPEEAARLACDKWLDVRSFGQLFAFKGTGKEGVSIPIRGPVTIQSAFSKEPVSVTSTQITKSVSGEGDGTKRSSDTMGMKHRVDQAIYVSYGAMTPQLAERTGFDNDDAATIKDVLPRLFEGDASSARPEGSMAVEKVIWWQHSSKSGQYSSARVHRTLKVNADGSFDEDGLKNALDGLTPEIIDGF